MIRLFAALVTFLSFSVGAQAPYQPSSSEIYKDIKKLGVLGNILYLAAHPDDENQRFITYCANQELYNTAYLSLTRGDGGQNLIGKEIREELGIIRTQELLAARRTDGGTQYFTRANDFGYSKTPEETFEIWDKEKILGDVVWVIRNFRPDVIVCRFPTDGGGGHGHHTASALLALEAFDLAADSTSYPEQLKHVDTWQATRVVVNTGRWWNDTISAEDPNVVAHDLGGFNALLGTSYTELAMEARSQHKCQGFGATGFRGEHIEYFEHLKGKKAEKSLFEGFNHSWSRIGEKQIESEIKALLKSFDIESPGTSVNGLISLRKQIQKIEDEYWKAKKLAAIDKLISDCLGLYIEAKADSYSKSVGDSLTITLEAISRSIGQDVFLSSITSKQLGFNTTTNVDISNNQKENLQYTFTTPELPYSQPYWLIQKPSMGICHVHDLKLIGKPENDASIVFMAHLNVNGEAISIEVPLIYKWNDPVNGESYRPFVITPEITANLNSGIELFSTQDKRVISVALKSHGQKPLQGNVELAVPSGWIVSEEQAISLTHYGSEALLSFELSPSSSAENGTMWVIYNGDTLKSFNEISYDHIPSQIWFPETESKLVYIDLKLGENKKIGYIPGAGDLIPEALTNIGLEVIELTEADLDLENLVQYQAIITGIRFVNVNERAEFIIPKLLAYAEAGGNLIMQYNTRHRMKTKDIGPYPITLSRDRVTEEDSGVNILDKNSPILSSPNSITQEDFNNWVQERGLYFPSKWDEHYSTLLGWHDKNEEEKTGSLLWTTYGKGSYVYTGISFFRELPAGVPGAYKLLVNLIYL